MIVLLVLLAIAASFLIAFCLFFLKGFVEGLSSGSGQDEDAFDRGVRLCKHAARPAEWENFPPVHRVGQAPTPASDVPLCGNVSGVITSENYLLADPYDIAKGLAFLVHEGEPICFTSDEDCVAEVGGWLIKDSRAARMVRIALMRTSYELTHAQWEIGRAQDLEDRYLQSLVREDLSAPLPLTNCLSLVEDGILDDLYDSPKWELGGKRSHSHKPKKDRQGKSWTSFDGRHMNVRKTLADMVNDDID